MVYIWIRYTGTIMYRIDLVDHTSSTGTVRPRAAGCRRDCFFNTPYDLWPWGPHSTASVRRVMLSATTRGHAGQRREHCLQHRCPPRHLFIVHSQLASPLLRRPVVADPGPRSQLLTHNQLGHSARNSAQPI